MRTQFKFRIGCDIGGTFTDILLINEETGNISLIKRPSTPRNPGDGALKGIIRAIETTHTRPEEIDYICHATTIATNAIVGQVELPKVGLITTKGYRDLVEIGRQIRPDPYDLFVDKPRPLVPRYLRKEVYERITSDGRILRELNEREVRKAVKELAAEHVEAIAVCTLFSFLNSRHEERIGEIIREEWPEAVVSLSHEVLPEFREYERASTTLINTYLLKIVDRYLGSLEEGLREIGVKTDLLIMQSSGRTMASKMARKKPVYILESGPAAGAIAAAYVGRAIGHPNLVSFDMGGTTAKACLIEEGWPKTSTDFEVGGKVAEGRILRGSGWPVKIPVTDLVEISAGGGSIAWIDSGGGLKVGPQSAGAYPGPSCYGEGGLEPTVTDAYVVLGVINPDYFLGGEMPIDAMLARSAVKAKVAGPLGMDEVEAASGIAEVANANMMRALRIVSVERGRDPRELALMAFGGAGPMVAGSLMEELRFQSVIIPEAPGLFSAYGLLVTDIGHDYVLTRVGKTDEIDPEALNRGYNGLEEEGLKDLTSEGFSCDRMVMKRSADMRYLGQSFELEVSVPIGKITKNMLKAMEMRFHAVHRKRYGYAHAKEPTEVVNLRVAAVGVTPKMKLRRQRKRRRDPGGALKGVRPIYFRKRGDYVRCPIYDRYRLYHGNVVEGPAVIEQRDSTTVVNPGCEAVIDGYRQILLASHA